jgi:hypothetical protein
MTQNLNGVDIYDCPYFEVDSSGRLKFVRGVYYDRTPESFKTITEIYNISRYCMWIINQKDSSNVSKYAAIVYMNRVNQKLLEIESGLRNILKEVQDKNEEELKKSIEKPGRTYL